MIAFQPSGIPTSTFYSGPNPTAPWAGDPTLTAAAESKYNKMFIDGNFSELQSEIPYRIRRGAAEFNQAPSYFVLDYHITFSTDVDRSSFYSQLLWSTIQESVTDYMAQTYDSNDPGDLIVIRALKSELQKIAPGGEKDISTDNIQKRILFSPQFLQQVFFDGGNSPTLTNLQKGEIFINKFMNEVLGEVEGAPMTDGRGRGQYARPRTIDEVNALNAQQRAALPSLAAGAGFTPVAESQLTEQEKINYRQCVLISDLLNKDLGNSYSELYMKNWHTGSASSQPTIEEPYHGRIYPVTDSPAFFEPDALINMCTTSKKTKQYFLDTGSKRENLHYELYWVYTDEYSGELRETEIFLTTNSPERYNLDELVREDIITSERVKKISWAKSNGYGYSITKVDVDFNGTNPSTARKDVKVNLTIDLDNLKSIDTPCAFIKMKSPDKDPSGKKIPEKDRQTTKIELRIFDLVTLPTVETIETRKSAGGGIHADQYSPDYSRLRLKVWCANGFENPLATEDALIIDLATIDHTLTRNDDAVGSTDLVINYAGYFETAMNDPFNDALVGGDIIANRYNRSQTLATSILDNKCSNELARELTRVQQEQDRLETTFESDTGGLIKRLFEKALIFGYEYNQSEVQGNRIGRSFLPNKNFVTNLQDLGPVNLQRFTEAAGWFSGRPDNYIQAVDGEVDVVLDEIQGFSQYGFFLGDLMNELLDCMYQNGSNEMRPHCENMNLRFLVGTFQVPHPRDSTRVVTINPLAIPLDLGFFNSWYHDTIVKKGLTSYPVGVFIKDLVERLVNNVIYETCFSILLPGETPPKFRSTFFTDHSKKWFKWKEVNGIRCFDPMDIQANAPARRRGQSRRLWRTQNEPNILMKRDINTPVAEARNYFVLYQQNPGYYRQLKYQRSSKLSNDPYTLTLYYGVNTKSNAYISDVKFTKTTSTYLREARYFNSDFGSLTLLANVYDLDFTIGSPKATTSLYPGNIINFILTDWTGDVDYRPGEPLGESDPHVEGTRANILGFGGYYIIKSVKYSMTLDKANEFKVVVSTKFLGTDALDRKFRENTKDVPFATDPKECTNVLNLEIGNLERVSEATGISAQDFERVLRESNFKPKEKKPPKAQKQSGFIQKNTPKNASSSGAAPVVPKDPFAKPEDRPVEATSAVRDEISAYLKENAFGQLAIGVPFDYPHKFKGYTGKLKIKKISATEAILLDKNGKEIPKSKTTIPQ